MLRRFLRSALIVGICSTLFSATQVADAALIVNYQFESTEGTSPALTTPDSSLSAVPPTPNFVSSLAPPTNALFGSANLPELSTGPVQNGLYASLNATSYMTFKGGATTSSSSSQTSISRVQISDNSAGGGASAGALDDQFATFSFAAWVNPTSLTTGNALGTRIIAGKMGGSGTTRGWMIHSPNTTSLTTSSLVIDYFAGSTTASGSRTLTVADVLPINTWTHVAFTFDNGVEKFYVNGIEQSFTGVTDPIGTPITTLNGSNSINFNVGFRGGSANNSSAWLGGIDDVRIYDEVLNAVGSPTVSSLLVPIPEPSTYAIAAMGLVGLVMFRRRK